MSGLRSAMFPKAFALVSLALIMLVRPAAAEPDLSADGAVLPPVVLGNVAAGVVDQVLLVKPKHQARDKIEPISGRIHYWLKGNLR